MSKELPPSRTADQFVVRFPDGMRDRIAEAAKTNGRSMNSEIVSRLDETFTRTAATHTGSMDLSGSSTQLQEIAQAHKETTKWLGQLNHALALAMEELASYVPEEMLLPGSAVERSVKIARALARNGQIADQVAILGSEATPNWYGLRGAGQSSERY